KVVYFFGTDGKLSTTDGWAGDYYVKGGAALTGMQTIDGADYFFGADGILQRGEIVWQNDTYFADAKGVVQRDMVRTLDDGTLRYYGADGKAVTAGWFKRGTDEYYQGKDMILAVGKRAIDGKLCFFGTDGKRKTTDGWAGDYYVKDGVALTGFQDALDGGTYVFNDEGVVFKGDFTWDGASYYGDPTTGAMLRSGIHAVADGSGNRYHDKDGKAVAGVWIDLDGARYYQTDALLLATGRQSIEDEIYYFETSGKLKTGTGWADSYYLLNGKVLTGGPHELEGKLYVFNDDGLVQKDNFEAKGLWYCADETGALYTDTIRTLPDGRLRYLDKTGAAKPGFIDYTDGSTYYQGTDGCLVTGLQTIDGKPYYFGEDGKKKADGWVDGYYLKDGKPVTGQQVIDNKTYIFDDSGHVKTGEFTYNGAAYAADEAGALYLDAVFTRKDGAKAYYGADGTAPAGWAESPTGAKYYQSVTNGVYALAVGLAPVGNETYYFLSSGKLFSAPAGWYIVNGKQCYLLADGRYCTPPAIEAVKTVYDAEKKLYSITIESTISTAAGTNAGGSFSFDGGLTWQASNVKTVPSDKGIMLSAGKIRVRDGVGQIVQYAKTIYLAPVVVIPGGSGNSGPGSYGIDVSQYNGAINWPAVKASGIQFALIRATSCNNSGYYVDPYFESNVRNAKAAGIDVGLYIFSYATSYGDVNDEINFFKNSQQVKNLQASGITLDYPVYIDYEANKNLNGTTYDQRTDYVRQAMVQLRNAGFYPGFYTYHSYCNYFNVAQLVNEGYDFWYARYPLAPNPPSNPSGSIGANVSIWQYCSDGNTNPAMQPHVNGVYTSLDLNYVYDDVPSRVHKFYGTGSSTTPPTAPDGIVTQNMLTVYDTGSGRIVTDTATNILAKIVQTEVGGFNNPEVYKAQAVAAYSYIMYQSQFGATPNVSLSSPSSAVTNAVNAVANKIVTYNGTVANTMYGAANSGKTQSTEAMWGGAYPYLVAGIDSPGDLSATVYANGGHTWQNYSNTISLARMTSNIEKMLPGTTSGRSDYENWIVNPEYDGNGYLTYITVMGTRIRAGKFYDNCWGLYSPNFNVSYNGNGTWTFVTRGNGHGVGMSQWGAWGFAKQGWNYEQILNYYYPGTAVSNMG
ncbi:MAG: SpoIID/LytB domain-containing protein, partial [Ruthenibacterium sp.]